MPAGRPSIYSPELATDICDRIASGLSLREICRADDMPEAKTVYRWLADGQHPEFRQQYARAREIQSELMAEEILEIADDARNDWMERQSKSGESFTVVDHDHVSRSKLRVDARKWMLSKVLPKKYGDRVVNVHEGGDKPIETKELSELEAARRVAFLLTKATKS
jgi:hypothetical protein